MARPTLFAHPKFAKLAARLKSRALAVGSLELIWDAAYASGDPVIGDAEAVEEKADWKGARGELAAALVQAGFLDREDANGGQVHIVHDLEDHAPDYVVKRWEREAKRQEKGQTLRGVRQQAARARWAHRAMQVSAAVAPPAPAPAPKDRSVPMQVSANGGQMHDDVWSPGEWKRRFGAPWCDKYGWPAYGMANDGIACGKLGDLLEQLGPDVARAAQAKAGAMFAAFLADDYAELIKAKHPFAWFVQRFGALMVDAPDRPALRVAPRHEPDTVLAPIGSASQARAEAAARRAQPHAASAAGSARPDTATPPLRGSGAS